MRQRVLRTKGERPQRALRGTVAAIALAWVGILLVLAFGIGLWYRGGPLSSSAMPLSPRSGEPVRVDFKVQNPTDRASFYTMKLLANGQVVTEEQSLIPGHTSERVEYVTAYAAPRGGQMVFVLEVSSSALGSQSQVAAVPPYPPAVISSIASFASFASLSSSAMSFVTTQQFYEGYFVLGSSRNVGLLFALVLLASLVMLEMLRRPAAASDVGVGARLRTNFGRLSWVLIIIVVAMMITQIALIVMKPH